MKKELLLMIFLIFSIYALADGELIDSVKLKEVEITACRLSYFNATEKVDQIDSLAICRYANVDLGTLLQKVSLINISSNGGVGALTTASIRGASSNQTSVTWNGLPLNSLTSGSADLSTITVGGFNDITITYGAAGTLYGSGTMGGAIELSNKAQWDEGLSVKVGSGLGSFSTYKGSAQVTSSSQSLSYQGQIFYHDSKNNFKYIDIYDPGHPIEKLTHNENTVIGTIHNLYWKVGKNLLDAGTWYQVKDKNIPGLMGGRGVPVSHQTQKDSTLKVYVGWKRLIGNCSIEAKSAYLFDFLRYTDKKSADSPTYKEYSEITTKRWLADINSRWYLMNRLSLDINGRYSRQKGITSNYPDKIVEHEVRLNAAVKYSTDRSVLQATTGKDWNYNESNRMIVTEMVGNIPIEKDTVISCLPDAPLMFSLSGKIIALPDWVALRAKIATHYRWPTFNERYWIYSGNLKLKPEEGFNIEVGAESMELKTIVGDITADVSYYWTDNNESIAWKPDGALWRPVNTGPIFSQGVDLNINHSVDFEGIYWSNRLMYGYNNAFDNDKNSEYYKQILAYRPKYTTKFSSDVTMSDFNCGVLAYHRSKTYTWEGLKVKGYLLIDLNLGYKFKFNTVVIDVDGRVENVFNSSYQLIRFYPMPGRAYYLSVNINL